MRSLAFPLKSREQALAPFDHSYTYVPTPSYDNHIASVINDLRNFFDGYPVDFLDVPLDLSTGTPFQQKVWRANRTIPYGQTRTYGWIASRIRNPKASRAVGSALGKNPIPIIIPCHRVVGSDGSLCGFGGGISMKKTLLSLESSTPG